MTGALAVRVVVAALALAGGVVTGCAATGLHQYWWGLLLAIATTAALLVAVPGGWWRRLPFALGWVAAVLVLADERPEGDFMIRSSVSGYLLLGTGVAVLLGGVVGLRRHSADLAINGRDPSTS